MSHLSLIRDQLLFARKYTVRLLDGIAVAHWFRQPTEGITHIAWQAGHLAVAQYGLALERIRGRLPGDADFITEDFRARFGRASVPDPDSAGYPSAAEIRSVFDRVHQQAMKELESLNEDELDKAPLKPPHSLFATKQGSLIWCANHELVHAGQIGLLRRLLGYAPLW
jgi:hypothetical protein